MKRSISTSNGKRVALASTLLSGSRAGPADAQPQHQIIAQHFPIALESRASVNVVWTGPQVRKLSCKHYNQRDPDQCVSRQQSPRRGTDRP
jgi:hypothetical protein